MFAGLLFEIWACFQGFLFCESVVLCVCLFYSAHMVFYFLRFVFGSQGLSLFFLCVASFILTSLCSCSLPRFFHWRSTIDVLLKSSISHCSAVWTVGSVETTSFISMIGKGLNGTALRKLNVSYSPDTFLSFAETPQQVDLQDIAMEEGRVWRKTVTWHRSDALFSVAVVNRVTDDSGNSTSQSALASSSSSVIPLSLHSPMTTLRRRALLQSSSEFASCHREGSFSDTHLFGMSVSRAERLVSKGVRVPRRCFDVSAEPLLRDAVLLSFPIHLKEFVFGGEGEDALRDYLQSEQAREVIVEVLQAELEPQEGLALALLWDSAVNCI